MEKYGRHVGCTSGGGFQPPPPPLPPYLRPPLFPVSSPSLFMRPALHRIFVLFIPSRAYFAYRRDISFSARWWIIVLIIESCSYDRFALTEYGIFTLLVHISFVARVTFFTHWYIFLCLFLLSFHTYLAIFSLFLYLISPLSAVTSGLCSVLYQAALGISWLIAAAMNDPSLPLAHRLGAGPASKTEPTVTDMYHILGPRRNCCCFFFDDGGRRGIRGNVFQTLHRAHLAFSLIKRKLV